LQPKRATGPLPYSDERIALPRRGLRVVRSRDDTTAAGTRPEMPVRILIVEDDFLVADQIAAALNEAGFAVEGIASSAEDALEFVNVRRPMLVIVDIRLAGRRDGIDLALELSRDHGIRSIFATAHYDRQAVDRAEPASPLGWLQKPYTMDSLLGAVRGALRALGHSPSTA